MRECFTFAIAAYPSLPMKETHVFLRSIDRVSNYMLIYRRVGNIHET